MNFMVEQRGIIDMKNLISDKARLQSYNLPHRRGEGDKGRMVGQLD